ncbi:MAG: S8 family peptidase [Clostridia bacterium]|nr:S8 family peptidase [Clostridia bacterium]
MNIKKIRSKYIHPMVAARIESGTKKTLPVIIYSHKTIEAIKDYVQEQNGKIKYELPFINAVAAEIPSDSVDSLAFYNMIKYIDDDTKVFKSINIASQFSGARMVNNYGYKGKDIGIAIIDTGVAPHNDLTKPYNRIVAFKDYVNNRDAPYDDDGHGTHVAGIAAGNGYSNSKYRGIAPEANIIGVKVLDGTGSGSTSDILAGLQWIINNKQKYNIKIVNMSLGTPADAVYREDPLAKGATSAVNHGFTVVTAAGNNGPRMRTINSPGTSPYVITVGAINDNRTTSYDDIFIADFSSRGPTRSGEVKPDVMAPGVDIISLSNKSLSGYTSHSGTSMAAPIISGAAALIYEKNGDISTEQIKRLVKNTAMPIRGESRIAQGAGVANIPRMLDINENQSTTPSPGDKYNRRVVKTDVVDSKKLPL